MAERKLAELEAEARRRWPVVECADRPPFGSRAAGRGERGDRRQHAPPRRRLCRGPVADRQPQARRSDLETRTLGRRNKRMGPPGTKTRRSGDKETRRRRDRRFSLSLRLRVSLAIRSRDEHGKNHRRIPPHRPPRPRTSQPADQRHRSLQHPLLLLHAERERPLQAAARDSCRSRRSRGSCGSSRKWACGDCGSRVANRSCGPTCRNSWQQLAADCRTSKTSR